MEGIVINRPSTDRIPSMMDRPKVIWCIECAKGCEMSECKCSLRGKLVGDGCQICNPQLTIQCQSDEIAELKQERDELVAQVEVMRDALELECSDRHGGDHHDDGCSICTSLKIAPSATLREIEARVLEELMRSDSMTNTGYIHRSEIKAAAAAKRKGE